MSSEFCANFIQVCYWFAFCLLCSSFSRTAAIFERGLNSRYGQKFKRQLSPMCLPSKAGSYTRIGLRDADFAFLLVFYGHVIGLIMLCVEFFLRKALKPQRKERVVVCQSLLVRWP